MMYVRILPILLVFQPTRITYHSIESAKIKEKQFSIQTTIVNQQVERLMLLKLRQAPPEF